MSFDTYLWPICFCYQFCLIQMNMIGIACYTVDMLFYDITLEVVILCMNSEENIMFKEMRGRLAF